MAVRSDVTTVERVISFTLGEVQYCGPVRFSKQAPLKGLKEQIVISPGRKEDMEIHLLSKGKCKREDYSTKHVGTRRGDKMSHL